MRNPKLRLISLYFLFSLGLGLVFTGIHATIGGDSTVKPGSYWMYFLIASVVSYLVYRRRYLGATKMDNNTGMLIAIFYVSGSVVGCFAGVTLYNDFSQHVVTLNSVQDIAGTSATYFAVPDMDRRRNRHVDTLEHSYTGKRARLLNLDYYALVPVATHPDDRRFTIWLQLHDYVQQELELQQKPDSFLAAGLSNGRKWLAEFPLEKVAFYTRNESDKGRELLQAHGLLTDQTIILNADAGSFGNYRLIDLLMYGGVYLLPSLLFVGLVLTIGEKKETSGNQ